MRLDAAPPQVPPQPWRGNEPPEFPRSGGSNWGLATTSGESRRLAKRGEYAYPRVRMP
jgi:hypothetical protein